MGSTEGRGRYFTGYIGEITKREIRFCHGDIIPDIYYDIQTATEEISNIRQRILDSKL